MERVKGIEPSCHKREFVVETKIRGNCLAAGLSTTRKPAEAELQNAQFLALLFQSSFRLAVRTGRSLTATLMQYVSARL